MAQDDIVICANCGTEKSQYEHDVYEPPTKYQEERHEWSDADPLARARAAITGKADGIDVMKWADNDEWQWIDVVLHDELATASEVLATNMKREGFAFCSARKVLGDTVLRFNRKKR